MLCGFRLDVRGMVGPRLQPVIRRKAHSRLTKAASFDSSCGDSLLGDALLGELVISNGSSDPDSVVLRGEIALSVALVGVAVLVSELMLTQ